MGTGSTEGLIPSNGVWGYTLQTPETFDQSTLTPNLSTIVPPNTYLTADTVLTVFNVKHYGAKGDGTTADKTSVDAAYQALLAVPRGGRLYFPPGVYKLDDYEFILPKSTSKAVVIEGDGPVQSRLQFYTDRGLGTFALRASATGGTVYSIIRNLQMIGPGQGIAPVKGTSPADMDGIRLQGGMHVENCWLSGWRSAMISTSDHIEMRSITASLNYYGLYYANQITQGDNLIDNCDLTNNAMASIAISSTAMFTGATVIHGHIGGGPYCIYIETGAGAALSMGSVQFLGTSWEGVGNAAIYSEGKTGKISSVELINCGNFSIDTNQKLPSTTCNELFYLTQATGLRLIDTSMQAMPATTMFNITTLADFVWDGNALDMIGIANTAVKPLFSGAPTNGKLRQGLFEATLLLLNSGTAAIGDLMSIRPTDRCDLFGASSTILLAGVSMQATASGTCCIVCTRGRRIVVNIAADVTNFQLLVPDTTTPRKAVSIAARDGRPVLGTPWTGTSGSAATCQADIGSVFST